MNAPHPADLTHVETWIFDLDNTLYAASSGIFAQIDKRMTEFIAVKYNLAHDAAGEMRLRYYRSHGTTLSGLMEHEGLDPHEFLSYVHDIDLSEIAAPQELRAGLARLPGSRIIYTNGSRAHAQRITRSSASPTSSTPSTTLRRATISRSPHLAAYEAFLEAHDIVPRTAGDVRGPGAQPRSAARPWHDDGSRDRDPARRAAGAAYPPRHARSAGVLERRARLTLPTYPEHPHPCTTI